MFTTLIQAAELAQLQSTATPLVVFDCSFDLANPAAGQAQFEDTHLAGARYVHLDQDLSAHGGSVALGTAASGGRHPLPTREQVGHWMQAQGLTPETQVVVYDRQGVNYCGRLWWMLKWAGHEAVAVLDGGLQAWQAMSGPVASGPSQQAHIPTVYPLPASAAALLTLAEVQSNLNQPTRQLIVDARGGPRYRGEVEPLDPIAGHIPGAINRPFTENFGPDGRFKPATVLRQEFAQLLGDADAATVVHQCGSGVSAVPNLLAMEWAGLGRTRLFAGSWSEWSNTPGTPVAKG